MFVVDIETTGTDVQRDRILEIGFQQWDAPGLVKEWRSLVDPRIPIPLEASKIHGYYDSDMARCQACHLVMDDVASDRCRCGTPRRVPWFKDLAPSLAKGLINCDFAGKNVRFDLRILAAEMKRADAPWSYLGARVIDAERLEQIAVPRGLRHLHEKYTGEEHEGAHGALSDVRATATVIAHQLQAHPSLSRDLDTLHAAQWPGWIDGEGKFKFVNGVPCFGLWGKYAGKPMRAADAGYWDFILKSDFSDDVKALARDVKLGTLPKEVK